MGVDDLRQKCEGKGNLGRVKDIKRDGMGQESVKIVFLGRNKRNIIKGAPVQIIATTAMV